MFSLCSRFFKPLVFRDDFYVSSRRPWTWGVAGWEVAPWNVSSRRLRGQLKQWVICVVHVGHTRSITKQATVVIVADYLQWNYFGVTKGLKQPSIKAALSDSTRKKANVTVIRCVWETEGANLGQTGACTRITRVMNVHVSVRPGLSGLGCACQRVFMN